MPVLRAVPSTKGEWRFDSILPAFSAGAEREALVNVVSQRGKLPSVQSATARLQAALLLTLSLKEAVKEASLFKDFKVRQCIKYKINGKCLPWRWKAMVKSEDLI